MSVDQINAIIERARLTASEAHKGAEASPDRERLKQIAAEFESMLLVQMLKDMRKAGSWDESDDSDTFGAESLLETLDVELAGHLARVRGMGLQDQLLSAFDRTQPASPTTESAPAPVTVAPESPRPVDPAMVKPVAGQVSSEFGWRRDPFTNRMKFHQGVDLKAAYGQEVQAAAAGTVVFSGDQGGYGTSVVIEHGDGTRTRYAHLSAALVQKGNQVGSGQPVGRAGRSGRATGPHLHFEVIARNGARVPPQQWASMGIERTGTSGD